MFEQCPVCAWQMRNKCGKCGAWCMVREREVRCVGMAGGSASIALRCLHCGHENFVDDVVAQVMIYPEILNAVKRKWEWEHPRV